MWTFFLYRVFDKPIEDFAQHLTHPHLDEEKLSCLDS